MTDRHRNVFLALPVAGIFLTAACSSANTTGHPDLERTRAATPPVRHQPPAPAPVAGRNHNIRIVDKTPSFAKGDAEKALVQFSPVETSIHVNDTVTWINETAYRCKLESINDQLPEGSGSHSIPAGHKHTIKFTRDFLTQASVPMFTYACEEFSGSQGVIFAE